MISYYWEKYEIKLSVKLNFVYWVFCLFLANKLYKKYDSKEVEESL